MKNILFITMFLISTVSYGIETIIIDKGRYDPIPIAVNNFSENFKPINYQNNEILKVIFQDLKNFGLFRLIPRSAFIEKKIGISYKPLFSAWRQINSNLLLNGEIERDNNRVKVKVVLWDTILQKVLFGEEFEAPTKYSRRVAHQISDKIYEKITGDKGYADTKVVYISESGPRHKRNKRVAMMDYDGANHQFLTDGKDLVLTPRLSPGSDKLMYLSYVGRFPRVYLRDLKTGKETKVGDFPGMTFSPRFSPDGKKALLSIAKSGITQIIEINLKNMTAHKITSGLGINTSPSYSPDGTKIVFNSDRSGGRLLYTMNSDGSNVQRISFGGGNYSAPAWSPRGDYIAFTKKTASEGFTIGLMRPDGSGERIIASGYLVEGPCWAPNGRAIMFSKEEPPRKKMFVKNRIFSIDITGYNELEIPTPRDASDPEWSGLLK